MAKTGREKPGAKSTKSRIPTFKTIEEEAEFWDTHSLAEFEDEFEDVTGQVKFVIIRPGPRKAVTVRLDQETYAALKQCAAEHGARPSKLVHYWIQKCLHEWKRTGHLAQAGTS